MPWLRWPAEHGPTVAELTTIPKALPNREFAAGKGQRLAERDLLTLNEDGVGSDALAALGAKFGKRL